MSEIDILAIDTDIYKKYQNKKINIDILQEKLQQLENYKISNVESKAYNIIVKLCDKIKNEIIKIKNDEELNFYISESIELINEYKKILKTPIKLNFTGKPMKNNKEKIRIISQYLDIAKKYIDIKFETSKETNTGSDEKEKIHCDNCKNKKNFEIIDNDIYICLDCFSQQIIFKHTSSYKDCDRINISSKYEYDRKIHFRDCINQYCGKQNSTVEQKVYDDLEREFEKHYLLIGNKNTPKQERFKNINKEHIMIFLKDLGYAKHYENLNLIHYNITGKKPDDITYLEDKLIADFDKLTELYDKMYKDIDRKNFINTQYCLFSLLQRHKHPCKQEDFSILKTIDRKTFHDEIMKKLFEVAGWNFKSLF
jgi:ribosomal protein S24E